MALRMTIILLAQAALTKRFGLPATPRAVGVSYALTWVGSSAAVALASESSSADISYSRLVRIFCSQSLFDGRVTRQNSRSTSMDDCRSSSGGEALERTFSAAA